ncbi:Gfo/Idh/MocA family oxidoreductase [Glycomyces sp. TRM65418]|uniref:Gfo/Idh/MocA family protein n=1 Tax=Glycomyces sp. TRM65418 TaxID=2867006 RepID=UPI001CE587B4|nr:Gfo/Idh/MocA family oxidoreductase [Glycomyces sp. TRM65418]MCC3765789.1 Gfo/Idh/MocA family oxidoreductase [Glycomyces sp. TRM65418]QZD55380.1 Gfo/Idh/MocA family oxidoreductase [Glycomyces sp. TRM65418]
MSIRIGVIGTGWIGEQHVRRLTELVSGTTVVAVSDIDPELAASVASQVGARVVDSAEKLVADPEVEAVVITSWGPVHAEQVLACIEAGKPVFCEKPLTTDAADGRRIMEAEQAFGRRLVQVGFMRRYDAGYRQMKRVLDSDAIGEPLMAHCVHRNPTVRESYTTEMAAKDTAVHEVDALRWLLGEEFTSVQTVLPRKTPKRFEHLQDPQIFLFETASGARVDVEVFVNCQYGYDIQCEIVGEDGAVRLPDPAAPLVRHAGQASFPVLQEFGDRFTEAFDVELQEWADRVAAGREPTGPNSWDGYAATVVTDAAVQSLHTGAPVPIDLGERPDFYA